MNDGNLIDVRDLEKAYGETQAVAHLNFRVAAGQILGLVGPNGAGKTTALRCMAGIIPASSGAIQIGGYSMVDDPIEAKAITAFIPDTPHLFDYLTVEEHLRFVGRIYQVDDVDEMIESLLSEFELVEKRRHLPQALSRGMRQKVAICVGFLHHPKVILLDEPLTGLDPIGIRNMKASVVRRAREENAAVIISSHQLDLVEEICDEVSIIKNGRCVISGSIDSLHAELEVLGEKPSLEEIFFHLHETHSDQ